MMELWALSAVVAVVAAIALAQHSSKQRAEAQRVQSEAAWRAATNDPGVAYVVEQLSSHELPPLETPTLNLQRNEFCFYTTEAEYHEMRTVTKRIDYAGVTTRIRVMRGVYLRSGSFAPRRVTEDQLLLQDVGVLHFTNKRLIFLGGRKNITIPRTSILGIDPMRDAIEVQKSSGRNPVFVNRDYRRSICMNAAASRFLDGVSIRPIGQSSVRLVAEDPVRREVLAGIMAAVNAFKPFQRHLIELMTTNGVHADGGRIGTYLKAVNAFATTCRRLLDYTAQIPEELRGRLGAALVTLAATQMCFEADVRNGTITKDSLVPLLDSVTALINVVGYVADCLAADVN